MKFLKKFDVYTKTIEGVTQQTIVGAFFTIIAVIGVLALLVSESYYFTKTEAKSRMEIDNTLGAESVLLTFDIEFFDVPCAQLNFFQEVARGTLHTHEPEKIEKVAAAIGEAGCRITGEIMTDKSAGYFQLGFPHTTLQPGIAPNLSHQIHSLEFTSISAARTVADSKVNPFVEKDANDQLSVGVHNYAITVVPSKYIAVDGTVSYDHDYSVTERKVSKDYLAAGVTLSGQYFNDFFGVVFTYDFSPVSLCLQTIQFMLKNNVF